MQTRNHYINVKIIREEHKQLELKYNFESHELDILGIQEHLIIYDETVKYTNIGYLKQHQHRKMINILTMRGYITF